MVKVQFTKQRSVLKVAFISNPQNGGEQCLEFGPIMRLEQLQIPAHVLQNDTVSPLSETCLIWIPPRDSHKVTRAKISWSRNFISFFQRWKLLETGVKFVKNNGCNLILLAEDFLRF